MRLRRGTGLVSMDTEKRGRAEAMLYELLHLRQHQEKKLQKNRRRSRIRP
jgi:hypothetical protein